ncbi:DUF1127 domain-containing protein [Roseibium sp. Sym1]|uniref:DUF1127 domain-containing protein n=1 Tax=Roseibium sp. Sym1 TaxID=3016006 RepID=UPI0022B43E81|nr:DUF1127 domain-containing protein [Roseibium sp. Sym1]
MTHSASTPAFALLGQMIARAWRVFNNRRQFAELKHWSDEQLEDIGLTRSDVRRALAGPFYTDPTSVVSAASMQRTWQGVRAANAAPDVRLVETETSRPGQLAA